MTSEFYFSFSTTETSHADAATSWLVVCKWTFEIQIATDHISLLDTWGGGISLEVASKQIYDIFKVLVNISVFTNMKAIAPLDPPM